MRLPRWHWPWTVAFVIGSHLFILAALEAYTLLDGIPENHLTASFRLFLEEQPNLALISLCAYVGILAVIVGHIFGHWGGRPPSERR